MFTDAACMGGKTETVWKWQHAAQNRAAQSFACGDRRMRSCQSAERVNQVPVLHPAGTGRFASQATEATIDVRLRGFPGQAFFEHAFHENDPAARRIHFLAQLSIR